MANNSAQTHHSAKPSPTPSAKPIIDVVAYEKVPPGALVPTGAVHEPPPFEIPAPTFDPMQILQAQRRLLRDQQRALRDMLLEMESPNNASAPTSTPYTDLITRSMTALDRSLGTIMHSLEHTFGTDGRGRRTQGTDR